MLSQIGFFHPFHWPASEARACPDVPLPSLASLSLEAHPSHPQTGSPEKGMGWVPQNQLHLLHVMETYGDISKVGYVFAQLPPVSQGQRNYLP